MIFYTIKNEHNVVVANTSEVFDTQSFIDHMFAINGDPRFRNDMNAIYDFRNVKKVTGDPACMLKLTTDMRDGDYMPNRCLIAVLCPINNPMYRILEGYFIMVRGTNLVYQFFEEDPDGLEWIGLTEEHFAII